MQKSIIIITLLFSLACGVATVPAASSIEQPVVIKLPMLEAAPVPTGGHEMIVTAYSLNVRACSDYECPSVGKWLHQGDAVTVYEIDGSWCRISTAQEWVACWWLEETK